MLAVESNLTESQALFDESAFLSRSTPTPGKLGEFAFADPYHGFRLVGQKRQEESLAGLVGNDLS